MRTIYLSILVMLLNTLSLAEVNTTVYLSEPNLILEPISVTDTIIEYPEIMVGTKLAIIVDSNEAERWYGGLFIEDANRDYGILTARDYNELTYDWEGSHFPAAGTNPMVQYNMDDEVEGFSLYTNWSVQAGNWFVIDYTALYPGPCKVSLYHYILNPPAPPEEFLIHELAFNNVTSRDFNADNTVGFADYVLLAECWQQSVPDTENPCFPADLNSDTWVDFNDLAMFAAFWLEKTKY